MAVFIFRRHLKMLGLNKTHDNKVFDYYFNVVVKCMSELIMDCSNFMCRLNQKRIMGMKGVLCNIIFMSVSNISILQNIELNEVMPKCFKIQFIWRKRILF